MNIIDSMYTEKERAGDMPIVYLYTLFRERERYEIVVIVYVKLINPAFHIFSQEMRMEPMDDHEEDEMEMSDDERDRAMSPMKGSLGPPSSKRAKMDNDSLKVRKKRELFIIVHHNF